MNKSILVIDDDVKLGDLIKEYLEKYSYKVKHIENPVTALFNLKTNTYDLIILDVMMPDMDGFETLKEIRKNHQIPVVMLTARGETTDKIVGLELGADDYLSKPFEPRELLARIQAIFRRVEGKIIASEEIRFKDIIINTANRSVKLNNKPVEFTTTEFDLLLLFAKNNSKVLSREYLMQKSKGMSWQYNDRSIDVMVSRLRTKLKDKNGHLIKTVQSIGYIFHGDFQEN